jgi:hypothetical protein
MLECEMKGKAYDEAYGRLAAMMVSLGKLGIFSEKRSGHFIECFV